LPFAGIESAYRPPAYGVGGFIDKFKSLHTYGLAVDMAGIQGPGSAEAMLWHQIAARNGIICPYGPYNRAEWNHCQATRYKMILADNPLRATVTADGPVDLDEMFDMAASLIDSKDFAASYELEVATAKPPVVTPVITKAVVRPQADAPRRSRFGLLQKTYHLPRIATKTKILAEEHHDQSKRARQAVALNREQARSQTRRDQHAKESKVTSRHRKA